MGREAKVAGVSELLRSRQTVLVVDDEPDILESLRDILEASHPDLHVIAVPGAAEALEVLRSRPVALILSDYKMPGMNGLVFLAEAHRVAPDTPRVLVTAFPDLDVAIAAINKAGIDYFLTKPFSPGAVIGVVRDLVAEHRARALRTSSFERARGIVEAARAARHAPAAPAAPGLGPAAAQRG